MAKVKKSGHKSSNRVGIGRSVKPNPKSAEQRRKTLRTHYAAKYRAG